jgi:UDP-N-acetylglucosamine--N-acetylmuramyl-(pentapeptide) pyrophosphoryl-undecaprenol N-acetylglucosamine transferase
VFAALPWLLARSCVVHQTGPADLERAQAAGRSLGEGSGANYRPRAFFREDMGAALAAADLVIGRAGSSSIAEPLAFGLPLVLVPLAAAVGGHQAANARAVESAGAALVIPEDQLDGARLAAAVTELLDDESRLRRMAEAARGLGRPGAADEIARDVLALGRCA